MVQRAGRRAVQAPARARRNPPPPAYTARPSRCAQIVEVNAEGLEAEIMNRDRPLVIDFYATW